MKIQPTSLLRRCEIKPQAAMNSLLKFLKHFAMKCNITAESPSQNVRIKLTHYTFTEESMFQIQIVFIYKSFS